MLKYLNSYKSHYSVITTQNKRVKLESINISFIALRISVSHSVWPIMDLETRCFHLGP